MASNLACIGLAVNDGTELGQLVTAAHRSARQIGVYDGVQVARWQDDSGAALILGWRSGELLDLIPAYTAASGGLLSGCHLINESVASAAVVDAEGEQLTAMAFDAEQYRQLQALGQPVSGPSRITALGVAVEIYQDDDVFAASPAACSTHPQTQHENHPSTTSTAAGPGLPAWHQNPSSPTEYSANPHKPAPTPACPAPS